MSTPINDGGCAFPCQPLNTQNEPMGPADCGMSLRDWFAGQALLAIASRFPKQTEAADIACQSVPVAEDCYKIADAMIEARSK